MARPPGLLLRPFRGRLLGLKGPLAPGAELDAAVERFYDRHFSKAQGVDRLVLLAFDEYHDNQGQAIGPARHRWRRGSDLYVSNSLVRAICGARPDRYLLGGSIHPYRAQGSRDACAMLEELAAAGAVLVKWLPIHQNIRADDPRAVTFLRTAARLGIAMLIHYGGEMTLSRQHMELESPRALLDVLRKLRDQGAMPTTIVAHAATPSVGVFGAGNHRMLIEAMLGEFADDPLYADISALAALGRTRWLRRLARRTEMHHKLVWGSDFPVPVMVWPFRRMLSQDQYRDIITAESWIERDLRLKRAVGFDEQVFTRAAKILGVDCA
jgi:hypothetical protein